MFNREDFWKKVKIGDAGVCWPWAGNTQRRYGYGKGIFKSRELAHRIAYQLTKGEIPKGKFVCHHCDNPPCCNPNHLWLGNAAENNWDRDKKGRTSKGDAHWTRVRPENLAKGFRNGHYTKPENTPRGKNSGPTKHPERMARGSGSGKAKLTESKVTEIRGKYIPHRVTMPMLAKEYGVSWFTIDYAIRVGWKHVG